MVGGELWRTTIVLVVLALIPIVPFLLFGDQVEGYVQGWIESDHSAIMVALIIVAALSTDVFLPVPSSVVSTWGGAELGMSAATVVSCFGMTLGAVIGFSAARTWGRPLAARLARPEELDHAERMIYQYGQIIILAARAIPVLAEVTVLLSGIHRQPWKDFLLAVFFSNLVIAFVYSLLGRVAFENQWFSTAILLSVFIPVILTLLARQWLVKSSNHEPNDANGH